MVISIVWIVFIILEQKTNLNHLRVLENKDICKVIMPSEDTKMLDFNQYQISNKAPFIIYTNLECNRKDW